jgi:hypothetical protein
MNLLKLKFPIGKYNTTYTPSEPLIKQWIKDIEAFPETVEALTTGISNEALLWNYRPDGWNVKQVIHHCADSHMNAVIRFKLALTEDTPTIRPYFEERWAELSDTLNNDICDSIMLLKGLHKKWGTLLTRLTAEQLKLAFIHPEQGRKITLQENIGIYAWHCNHHLAHIKNGIASKGKYTY